MSLHLQRSELVRTGSVFHRNTLGILPSKKDKGKLKLVIGDESGTLICYEFKKGEPILVFKIKLFDEPITCIDITDGGDKVFVSDSQRIVGVSKKGKQFFQLSSSLTESISRIGVDGVQIWTACEYIHNFYVDGVDSAFYMSPDRVNDMAVVRPNVGRPFAVLACQDDCLRVMVRSSPVYEIPMLASATCVQQFHNSSSGRSSIIYGLSDGSIGYVELPNLDELFGETASMTPFDGKHCILAPDDGQSAAAVSVLTCFDINGDGVEEIIVGRTDGQLEVLDVPSLRQPRAGDNGAGFDSGSASAAMESKKRPGTTLLFSSSIGETIRSAACGPLQKSGYMEIAIVGHSGRVVSFTTEPIHKQDAEDSFGRTVKNVNDEKRIKALRREADELKKKLEQQKSKGAVSKGAGSIPKPKFPSDLGTALPAVLPNSLLLQDLHLTWSLDLDQDKGSHVLSIETEADIDFVLLQSDVSMEVIDVSEDRLNAKSSESSTARDLSGRGVLSVASPAYLEMVTAQQREEGVRGGSKEGDRHRRDSRTGDGATSRLIRFSASYRYITKSKKVTLYFRHHEGEAGTLGVTVIVHSNRASAGKRGKVLAIPIKPLSMHLRVHNQFDSELKKRKKGKGKKDKKGAEDETDHLQGQRANQIAFSEFHDGSPLSITSIYDWILSLFAGLPAQLAPDTLSCSYSFRSLLTGASARCSFDSATGTLLVEAEDPSTIMIAKESLSQVAMRRRVRMRQDIRLEEKSVEVMLTLLWARTQRLLNMDRMRVLENAVKEIAADGSSGDPRQWLSADLRRLLEEDSEKNGTGRNPGDEKKQRAMFLSILTNMYINWWRLKNCDIGGDVRALVKSKLENMKKRSAFSSYFHGDSPPFH
jgi:hypothetical protein